MDEEISNKQLLSEEDLIRLFQLVYNLPNYADQIKDTLPDTPERTGKLKELADILLNIYQTGKLKEIPSLDHLTPNNYNKQIVKLKEYLIDRIQEVYHGKPSFQVVHEIHERISAAQGNSLLIDNLCESLMMDYATQMKEQSLKKGAKEILEQMFKKFDLDGDGVISIEEMEKTVAKFGLPSIMAKEIMQKADIMKDGYISMKEFEEYSEQQILNYYKIFFNLDSDGDGRLNYKQSKQTLHEIYPLLELNDNVYQKLFDILDQDRTKLITFTEWCEFLLIFPQRNLEYMVNQYKLYALTMIDPLQPAAGTIEKDMIIKQGHFEGSYREILKTFLCGGIAGGVSRTVTSPLEQLKVLYQTMYVDSKPPNLIRGLLDVYRTKGLTALWRGNSLSIVSSVLEQAMRFVIIEYSKKYYEDDMGYIDPHNFIIIGIVTGILSTIVIFPLDVIRIRVISLQQKETVIHKAKKMYSNFGIRGFYSGLIPHLISVLPAGSLNVFFYNVLRKLLIKESDAVNLKVHKFMFLGGTAALITGTITYPFSLLTSRLIVANRDKTQKKVGLFSMFKSTLLNEGLFGFYKGYQASMLRMFIGQSVNFGTYETLKSYFNLHQKKKK